MRGIFGKVLLVVYVVVGLIVANAHHYFAHLDGIKPIASAVLAVLLWPLVLFDVSGPWAWRPTLHRMKMDRRSADVGVDWCREPVVSGTWELQAP